MVTAEQIQRYIEQIAPILQAEAKARGYKIVSPAIAQALQESLSNKTATGISGLATKYNNHHGMKCGQYWIKCGKPSISLKTGEEYKVGVITQITDYFRVYSDMVSGLKGYYEFLEMKRYAAVKATTTPKEYMETIKAVGYCTSSTYVKNCLAKIDTYNLTKYDNFSGESVAEVNVSKPKYMVGRNYTLQNNMYVRESAAGEKKPFLKLSTNAKSNGYQDSEGNGILKKGTVVTCKAVVELNGATWMKIPSGFVCAVSQEGKKYIL